MSTDTIPSDQKPTLWRSRWAAIGAAVAVSFGAGGFLVADAAGGSESSTVLIDPARIMDTRDAEGNVGLAGPFVSAVSQKLQVTGEVPTTDGPKTVVPDGATGVLMNVTAVNTTANGFISVRPGDATGAPATSSLNVTAGVTVPNAVQVALPTAGADAGKIDITFDALGVPGPTTDILVDVVGYFLEAGTGPQPADNGVDYTSDNVAALLKFEDPQSLIDLTIDAPKAGHVVLSAMVELVPTNAAEVGCTIVVDPTSLDGAHAVQVDFITNWNDTRGFAVPEGPTTFHIVCQQNSGNDDDVTVQTRNLTAVFSSAQL